MTKTSHDKIAKLLQEIADETGEVVESVRVEWLQVIDDSGVKVYPNSVDVSSIKHAQAFQC